MTSFFARIAGWFTDSRRAALQALIATSLTLLVVVGGISADQSTALNQLAASALLLVQGVIGLSLLRPSEFYTWLNTIGRGLVYGLATALGLVGAAFSLFSPETSGQIVAISTVAVSILTAFVQVVNGHTIHNDGVTEVLELPDEVTAAIAKAVAAKRDSNESRLVDNSDIARALRVTAPIPVG